MRADQARTIPIVSYLELKGARPVRARKNGTELWYHSPIRQGDAHPSFKVNTDKNLWYDHGIAKGGNIIDLVLEQYQCSVSEALHKLERSGLSSASLWTGTVSQQKVPRTENSDAAGEKQKSGASLEFIEKSELKSLVLLDYLRSRHIDLELVKPYISQIHFKAPQSDRTFFGLGWYAGDGFEVRSERFKGFVGTSKNITHIDNRPDSKLLVFEGFMDFLTYLTAKHIKKLENSVVVLNSTNLWRRVVPLIEGSSYKSVRLFLDNDAAGDEVTSQLSNLKQAPPVLDMRLHYAGQEDLNAWWIFRSQW